MDPQKNLSTIQSELTRLISSAPDPQEAMDYLAQELLGAGIIPTTQGLPSVPPDSIAEFVEAVMEYASPEWERRWEFYPGTVTAGMKDRSLETFVQDVLTLPDHPRE
jgi:hypothetical protein